MTETLKRLVSMVLGLVFIVLGFVGLFLPFLQGILFLLIGFSLLSYKSEWAQRFRERLRRRYPESIGRVELLGERVKDYLIGLWQRVTGRANGRPTVR